MDGLQFNYESITEAASAMQRQFILAQRNGQASFGGIGRQLRQLNATKNDIKGALDLLDQATNGGPCVEPAGFDGIIDVVERALALIKKAQMEFSNALGPNASECFSDQPSEQARLDGNLSEGEYADQQFKRRSQPR